MESIIKLLPEFLANQIAAGEVVQRPESVIKELVENAIDAGATSIAIVIHQAGKSLIHVIDNGKGMSADDLPLAIKRHATSKIASVEDLHRIMTLGFRGEALASISAVALLEIRSKQESQDIGYRLVAEPLKQEIIEPFHCDKGTQVIVKNLFFNVPARKKFLRSTITEFRHISETVIKFTLARPDIRFVFSDEKSVLLDVHPQSLDERIRAVCGATIADALHKVEYERDGIMIKGYVGNPSTAQHTRGHQHLFLNGRAIISRSLHFAITQVYEPYIAKNTYPFFVLDLLVNPESVDVNVHPQKHEVKFDNERLIFSFIQEATLLALNSAHAIPEMNKHEAIIHQPFAPLGHNNELVNRVTGEILSPSSPRSTSGTSFSEKQQYSSNKNTSWQNTTSTHHISQQELTAYEALFGKNAAEDTAQAPPLFSSQEQSLSVYQIHKSYIVYQSQDGLSIIDQHNAHLRILYDQAMQLLTKETSTQQLLFPITVPITPSEKLLVEELYNDLLQFGFSFTCTDSDIIMTAVPSHIPTGDEEAELKKLLVYIAEDISSAKLDAKRKIALGYARSHAVNSGTILSQEQMRTIVHDIEKMGKNPMSPYGKPIMMSFSLDDFIRTFRK